MNSYRTEAQGAAEILSWTPPESILNATLYIDNKRVVQRIIQERPIHPLQAKWELLEHTRQYVQNNKITVEHIQSHQDLQKPTTAGEAHLNHKADRLADKAHGEEVPQEKLPPGCGIILYINGQPVMAHYSKAITRLAMTPFITEYYKKSTTGQITLLIAWTGAPLGKHNKNSAQTSNEPYISISTTGYPQEII